MVIFKILSNNFVNEIFNAFYQYTNCNTMYKIHITNITTSNIKFCNDILRLQWMNTVHISSVALSP